MNSDREYVAFFLLLFCGFVPFCLVAGWWMRGLGDMEVALAGSQWEYIALAGAWPQVRVASSGRSSTPGTQFCRGGGGGLGNFVGHGPGCLEVVALAGAGPQ